ncbi:DNA modification system-associated small protein [Gluconobacter oxydans]|uniref:DNA modification system-associated small protein n=1 Tax=Gluconobacter oxydans TaxID=442 RepID=UPI0039E80D2F
MYDTLDDDSHVGDLPLWADPEANEILERIANKNQVPLDVLTELVTLQRSRQHQERAAGINQRIEEILGRID